MADAQRSARMSVWNRRAAIFWSIFVSAISALIGLSQVTEEVRQLPLAAWFLTLLGPLFVIFVAVILTSLSLRYWRTVWGVIGAALIGSAAITPTVLAVLAPSFSLPIWFFVGALSFWVVVALVSVSSQSHTLWTQVLLWLGAASTVAAIVCEIGLHGPIRFATDALREARSLSVLLDVRITLSVLFASLCVITAVVRGFLRALPDIPKIPLRPLPRVSEAHPLLSSIVNPWVLVLNAVGFVIISLLNVLVGVVVTICLRVIYSGDELGKLLWRLLFEGNAFAELLKALLATIVAFVVVVEALNGGEPLRLYLTTTHASGWKLLPVMELAAIVVVCATVTVLVIDARQVVVPRILFGASLLAVLITMSGGLVYAFAATGFFHVVGFSSIGIVSWAGLILLVSGAVAVTVTNVVDRARGRRVA